MNIYNKIEDSGIYILTLYPDFVKNLETFIQNKVETYKTFTPTAGTYSELKAYSIIENNSLLCKNFQLPIKVSGKGNLKQFKTLGIDLNFNPILISNERLLRNTKSIEKITFNINEVLSETEYPDYIKNNSVSCTNFFENKTKLKDILNNSFQNISNNYNNLYILSIKVINYNRDIKHTPYFNSIIGYKKQYTSRYQYLLNVKGYNKIHSIYLLKDGEEEEIDTNNIFKIIDADFNYSDTRKILDIINIQKIERVKL